MACENEAVMKSISTILTLEAGTMQKLMDKLNDIGVTCLSDLQFVQDNDLLDVLKPIQTRKLLRSLQSQANSLNAVVTAGTSCSQSSRCSTPSSGSVNEDTFTPPIISSNWVKSFVIPWTQMPTKLMKNLNNKERPAPKLRREMVRLIVQEIMKKCNQPSKKQLEIIAHKVVQEYPESFEDRLNETVIGSGSDSLLSQLCNRVENVKRVAGNPRKQQSETSDESTDLPLTDHLTAKKMDSYGCINWQPDEPDENDVERYEYYKMRCMINNGASIKEIGENWPHLLEESGLLMHFNELVGCNLLEVLTASFETKGKRILDFIRNCKKTKEFESTLKEMDMLVNVASDNSSTPSNNPSLPAIVLLIMKYFNEKDDAIFKIVEGTTVPEEISRKDLPHTPCVFFCGNSQLSASRFFISMDGQIIIPRVTSFLPALALFFATFYCFNIRYPEEVGSTLEFIQRSFVGINPDRGTKVSKGKKKRSISRAVLNFINDLANFEWA